MTENFATSLIIGEDASGPAGLVAGPFMVYGVSALLTREVATMLERRDFWRGMTVNEPVISMFSAGWEFDVGDGIALDLVLDALADPDRGTDVAGVRTWKFGRPDDVRRFDLIFDPVEGGHYELRGSAVISAQLVMERGRLVTCVTQWVGRSLTTEDSAPSFTSGDNAAFAAAPTVTVDIGGEDWPVFAGAISFNRPLSPAQLDLDSVATKWTGRQTVDIVGRLLCRTSVSNFGSLIRGNVVNKELTFTIECEGRTRTLTIPAARLEMAERTMIGEGTYEYVVEFAALRLEGEDLMTATSEAA